MGGRLFDSVQMVKYFDRINKGVDKIPSIAGKKNEQSWHSYSKVAIFLLEPGKFSKTKFTIFKFTRRDIVN